MATQQPGFRLGTKNANADLRTHQFKFVKPVASDKIDLVTTLGGLSIGVLQNKPNTGEVADVMVQGVSKVIAGAAIASGQLIASTAAGLAKVASAGEIVVGQSVSTTAGANEILEVCLGAPGSGGKA
jgi:6,7-dimethyl-8-ribityllumazine synthase